MGSDKLVIRSGAKGSVKGCKKRIVTENVCATLFKLLRAAPAKLVI